MAERPIILDGIGDFVAQADVADRSFFLHLSPISEATRRTEEAFWADFDRDCPKLLGGLLDAVSAGMRMMPNVHLEALSRMADAERWGEAVARGSAACQRHLQARWNRTGQRRARRCSKTHPWPRP